MLWKRQVSPARAPKREDGLDGCKYERATSASYAYAAYSLPHAWHRNSKGEVKEADKDEASPVRIFPDSKVPNYLTLQFLFEAGTASKLRKIWVMNID